MTETPCVVVNVQRLGPSTGGPTLTSQGDMVQAQHTETMGAFALSHLCFRCL